MHFLYIFKLSQRQIHHWISNKEGSLLFQDRLHQLANKVQCSYILFNNITLLLALTLEVGAHPSSPPPAQSSMHCYKHFDFHFFCHISLQHEEYTLSQPSDVIVRKTISLSPHVDLLHVRTFDVHATRPPYWISVKNRAHTTAQCIIDGLVVMKVYECMNSQPSFTRALSFK